MCDVREGQIEYGVFRMRINYSNQFIGDQTIIYLL